MYKYFVHHQPAEIIEDGYHDIIIENIVFNERIGQGVHIYNLLEKNNLLKKGWTKNLCVRTLSYFGPTFF